MAVELLEWLADRTCKLLSPNCPEEGTSRGDDTADGFGLVVGVSCIVSVIPDELWEMLLTGRGESRCALSRVSRVWCPPCDEEGREDDRDKDREERFAMIGFLRRPLKRTSLPRKRPTTPSQ